MKRLIATIAAAAAVAVPALAPVATGGAEPNGSIEAPACDPGRALQLARSAYAPERWRGGPAREKARLARAAGNCRAGRAAVARQRRQFRDYRRYRRAAPHRGPRCAGPKWPGDKCWWAVPWRIVCGESGGDFTPDFGNTRDGAYQIIPGTWAAYGGLGLAPYPSAASPLEQHVVADRIADDVGTGAWYGSC